MDIPASVTTAPDPSAAFVLYKQHLAAKHNTSIQVVDEVMNADMLALALTKRSRMEVLWPDCPRDRYVYACFNRPASEYYLPLPSGALTLDQPGDWQEWTAWTYIATVEPLEWPDVQFLRAPALAPAGAKEGSR